MTLTGTQERIVELAMDNIHRMGDEAQRATSYAIDQLVEGASPEYHEVGARPERDKGDAAVLIEAVKARLRVVGVDTADAPAPTAARTWSEGL